MCGAGVEQGFSFELGPGESIRIKQASNTFDSRHTLRYGGSYPGDFEVECVDDPDLLELSYTNGGHSTVAVYFVVDGYSSDSAGDFVLEWEIDTPGNAPCCIHYQSYRSHHNH